HATRNNASNMVSAATNKLRFLKETPPQIFSAFAAICFFARSSCNQQSTRCKSVNDVVSGYILLHTCIAKGHLAVNGHPFGGENKSGGVPAIGSSSFPSISNRGIE